MNHFMMKIFFLSLIAIFCGQLGNPADAAERHRTLSLSATGTVSAKPDIAEISTGVVSDAKTARDALSANNDAMAKIITALKAAGVKDTDIQTSNFSVSPRYLHRKNEAAIVVGYKVSNSVRIIVRDIAKLGKILDQVVTLGSNQINSINFSIANTAELLNEARKKAMASAIAKAKLYAEASGATLGKVLTINEQTFNNTPRPVFARAMKMEAAPAVPIEAGEQELQIRVSVSWELE